MFKARELMVRGLKECSIKEKVMFESMPKEIGNKKFKMIPDIALRMIKRTVEVEGTKLNLSFEEM